MLDVWKCDYYYYAEPFCAKRSNWPSARLLSKLIVSSIRLIWNIDSHLLAVDHIYFNANIGMHWNAVQHNKVHSKLGVAAVT